MLNIIYMDMRRMLKGISTWVILGSMVAFMLLGLFMQFHVANENAQELAAYSSEASSSVRYEQVDTELLEVNTLAEIMTFMLSSGALLIFSTLFAALFTANEFKSGFIKNISNHVKHRRKLVFSRLITFAVFSVIMMALVLVAMGVASSFLIEGFTLGEITDVLFIAGMHVLLSTIYSVIVMAITYVCNNAIASVFLGSCMSIGLGALIYQGINWVLQLIGVSKDFNIATYTVSNSVTQINQQMSSDSIIQILIIAAAWLAAMTFISCFIYEKRDVR